MQRQTGFTLIEIVIVMTIFMGLVALAVPNLLGARNQADINSAIPVVIADVKGQQLKAMLGDTEGRGSTDTYGVYFGSTTYTLFHGSSYNALDSSNEVVSLSGALHFSNITFANSQVVFQKGSGEIIGYNSSNSSVALTNPNNNESRTVTLNSFGTVTGVQ